MIDADPKPCSETNGLKKTSVPFENWSCSKFVVLKADTKPQIRVDKMIEKDVNIHRCHRVLYIIYFIMHLQPQ